MNCIDSSHLSNADSNSQIEQMLILFSQLWTELSSLSLGLNAATASEKLHPSTATVAQQFTGAAGIWGPRPKPFICGFGKSTGLLSSNTLGDNGLETHRVGRRLSRWLRAGADALKAFSSA